MEKDEALKIVADLMEPFSTLKLNYDNDEDKWAISVQENGIYHNQIEELLPIVKEHQLEYAIEDNEITFWKSQ